MNNTSGAGQHAISLPKGGGALKGIGETFQPNLFSGTGNCTVPIAVSPGRNGFGPSLSLQYSSGNGNGPFGLGWQLSIPRITRKTEKGLPRYDDTDVFVMSGAEDLVPYLKQVIVPATGQVTWIPEDPIDRSSHMVRRYRPRTEGLFARIEQWRNSTTDEVHWRTITRDNVTSVYGGTRASRIADPENEKRVFEWLLQETFDATGNRILYEYARDNPQLYTNDDPQIGLGEIFDRHRNATQLYIRRICYGNFPDPLVDEHGHAIAYPDSTPIGQERDGRRYAFEVIFDYGDWDIPTKDPHPGAASAGYLELFGPDPSVSQDHNPVPVRDDRFSSFRARFEIRTLRRCRRVLMFHHFAELGGPTLVRSTDFDYRSDPDTLLSLLSAVTVKGYQKDAAGAYKSAAMPPVTLMYSEFRPHEQRYQSVAAQGHDMPPLGLGDPNVALVDLFGDGLPDVLHGSPAGFRYWRNLGGGLLDRPRSLTQIPAGLALAQAGVGFGDMAGDGQTDLLVHSGRLPGFFETSPDGTWQTFKPYKTFPSFELQDADVRLVDLTGDGLSDALMTQGNHFVWFQCLGEQGFGPPSYIPRTRDLDEFPDVFFSDPASRVRLADMTGSGLNDIVLIHNGRIDYWPNLGYGHFGRRITMGHAPRLEVGFDPGRLFLADLNGNGCADLVYVDFDRVHFWFNQSGNGWSRKETLTGTPPASNLGSIRFADVFGTGTATLLWSYDVSVQREGNYKALDFCGGVKPYVLVEMRNNIGATTRVSYAPSTRYFLEDQANGTPWITRLPFPVQVVEKVEVIDHISRTKLATAYKYHHGYFDGREREFRGFGRVDRFDTETFEDFTRSGLHDSDAVFSNNASAYHVPPVETRSWFHTGIYFDQNHPHPADPFDYRTLTSEFRREFYQGDAEALPIDEHSVETADAPAEAYRALRGALLRTEVYGRDGSTKADHPYEVTETRHHVARVQPKDGNHHGVYLSYPIESLNYHYERNPADPRISQTLTLEVDAFGNPLKSIAIAYGRREPDTSLPTDEDRRQQSRTHVTCTLHRYTNAIDDPVLDPDNYRTPLASEKRTYELTGFTPANDARRFSLDEWVRGDFARLNGALEVRYEAATDPSHAQKRLIEHVRTRFRTNDLTDLLPPGGLESLAIPGESYKLAFTPGLVAQGYGARVTDSMLAGDGGYGRAEDGTWWVPSGRVFLSPRVSDSPAEELAFARRHFFSTCRSRDPFGNTAMLRCDAYDLLLEETSDPLGNRTIGDHDYRLLRAFRMTDPNGNRTEVAFDTLGLVVGTAVMGKITETKGDSLAGFVAELTPQQRQDCLGDPLGHAAALLGQATSRIVYDLDRYHTAGQPMFAATLARETHASDPLPPDGLKVQVSLSYSDGFGREIQKKLQAEPGPVVDGGPPVSPRWVGTGWSIFNNKGREIKQYEPFFDSTHAFRFNHQAGVSSTVFYDPVERVVATLHPDHTWQKAIFDPWRHETWDVNDTVLIDPRADIDVGVFFQRLAESDYLPTWHAQRQGGALGPDEQRAAAKTALHAATPTVACIDSLGRTFLTVAHNRYERSSGTVEEKYASRVVLDIEGNQREVIDAKDRIVMRYDYDMLGARIHSTSMEAGERWTFNDVAGAAVRAWDSRGHQFGTAYDSLRRPTERLLRDGAGPERVIGRTIYGESLPAPETRNQRGKVVQLFDQAGVVTSEDYDFKGNLLASRRQFAREYKSALDWSASPALEPEIFTSSTTYDALNRPLTTTSPDGSVHRPTFNEANLLEKVDVHLRGAQTATSFVTDIDYDAKGQRTFTEYGNGVRTAYAYDPLTFRLTSLGSTRLADQALLQDLRYTYDAGGNITRIADRSQQTLYFNNQAVTPDNDHTYDALYRLIASQGREHVGQISRPQTTWDDRFRVHLPHPGDGPAMRRYTERFEYDAVGNFQRVIHKAANGDWTRRYDYDDPSLIQPDRKSNRLSHTVVGSGADESYPYDAHGNMLRLPHLPRMDWNVTDQLQHVDLEGGGQAFYVYDAAGQRVRKVIEKNAGTLVEDTLYLGGFEVFRRLDGAGHVTLARETLHVMEATQRVALVERRTRGNDGSPEQCTRYQFGTHLGSVSFELDDAARVISYEEYYPFGTTSYQAVRSQTDAPKRYRYTRMERDEESGLAYHCARFYAPWIGRWTSCDPASIAVGLNLYTYALNNPLLLVDRLGTEPLPDVGLPIEQDASGDWYYSMPGETFEITGTAPPPEVVDQARKSGFAHVLTRDEFERVRNFENTAYETWWTDESAAAYWRDFPEEASERYYGQLQAEYNDYTRVQAAEINSSLTRLHTADVLVNAVGGVTVAAAGGFLLVEGAPLLGLGGGGTGGSTLTTIEYAAVRTTQIVTANKGAAVATAVGVGAVLPPGTDLPLPYDEVGNAVGQAVRSGGGADDATKALFGPFRHGLNKGGLDDIVANQRLLSTEARSVAGETARVRASVGPPDTPVSYGGPTMLEFYTKIAPDWVNKPNDWVGWTMPAGDYLPIFNLIVHMSVD